VLAVSLIAAKRWERIDPAGAKRGPGAPPRRGEECAIQDVSRSPVC